MKRRAFVVGLGNLSVAGMLLPACSLKSPFMQGKLLASAVSSDAGGQRRHFVAAINSEAELISTIPLPERGHDILALPNKPGHAVVIARRPDTFGLEVDLLNGAITTQFSSKSDTHFYGHACLSRAGDLLFTSENRYDDYQGLVVVRRTSDYEKVGEFESFGIGPHQLKMLPDGETLVVANGGIATHPDTPRVKLNLHNMQPNLAYINVKNGQLIQKVEPPDSKLSLRHLDVTRSGRVVVAAQYQGNRRKVQPLVFSHSVGQSSLQAFSAGETVWKQMQQYVATVVADDQHVFVSCPRGNVVCAFEQNNMQLSAVSALKDVGGLAVVDEQLLASNGLGEVVRHQIQQGLSEHNTKKLKNFRFDNHMTLVSVS